MTISGNRAFVIQRGAAILAGLLLLIACCQGARAAASNWVGDRHSAARLVSATEATGSAKNVDVGIEIRLAPGWHTYWRSPGDAGIPPHISWTGSRNFASAALSWPAPERVSLQGFENATYQKDVILPVAVALKRAGQPLSLRATVDYAACSSICVPYHAKLRLDLPAGLAVPGRQAARIAHFASLVPESARRAGILSEALSVIGSAKHPSLRLRVTSTSEPFRAPDVFVEGGGNASFSRPAVALSAAGRDATLTIPVRQASRAALLGKRLTLTLVDGRRAAQFSATPKAGSASGGAARGFWAILGIAILGGLILNVMPCVLPVLSLKLIGIGLYAGAERRAVREGFAATALGILFSFLILAGFMIVLRSAGAAIGWGIEFQEPVFLVLMIALLSLFAANLWDWFSLPMPAVGKTGGLSGANGKIAGSFLTGAFATVLATPCSAPFVGTAIGFALTRSPIIILTVFLGLGFGFALPYLLVAAAPGLVHFVPRPGRWMLNFRRVMGILLLGTALWLLSVLWAEAGRETAILLGLAVAAMFVLLGWRSRIADTRAAPRRALAVATAAVLAFAFAVPSLSPGTVATAAVAPPSHWQSFDAARLKRLVGEGKTVFVDVSADWCLSCKLNKLAVIDRNPVAARLRQADTVDMRADWTRPDPAINAYLESFGRYGIPFDAVYGPARPDGIALPEILTSKVVMEAFRDAVARRTAAK